MSVTPLNPKTVRADEREMDRPHVERNRPRIEQGPTGHLLDALRARARQPEPPGREKDRAKRRGPLEDEPIVPASDRER